MQMYSSAAEIKTSTVEEEVGVEQTGILEELSLPMEHEEAREPTQSLPGY